MTGNVANKKNPDAQHTESGEKIQLQPDTVAPIGPAFDWEWLHKSTEYLNRAKTPDR